MRIHDIAGLASLAVQRDPSGFDLTGIKQQLSLHAE